MYITILLAEFMQTWQYKILASKAGMYFYIKHQVESTTLRSWKFEISQKCNKKDLGSIFQANITVKNPISVQSFTNTNSGNLKTECFN